MSLSITHSNSDFGCTSDDEAEPPIRKEDLLDIERPIPLVANVAPPMATECFPGWLGDMIQGVSAATETPIELPAMMALGVLATATARRFDIEIEQGYKEPLNVWPCPAMKSGNRKSAVVRALSIPLNEWERDRRGSAEEQIRKIESKRKTLSAQIKRLRSDAAKITDRDKYDAKAEEIAELELRLPVAPKPPRLYAADITPEHLSTMLHDHNEHMTLLSDEGGLFEMMAGQYSNGIPNLDIYLQGHAGSDVRVDRCSRASVSLDNPRLTIALSPQPGVLQGMTQKRGFRNRGLLARFIFVLPISKVGRRTLDTTPIPHGISGAYNVGIRRLLDIEPDKSASGKEYLHVLKLTNGARDTWKAKQHAIEAMLAPGGKLDHIEDWGSKLPGLIARLAGNLHCVEHSATHPKDYYVSEETMVKACQLADVLVCHALNAFDLMGADAELGDARKVLAVIERKQLSEFTRREVWNHLKRHFPKVDAIDPALKLLEQTGHITPLEVVKANGRPSPRYATNLHLCFEWQRQE